jgi:hypothetical protein
LNEELSRIGASGVAFNLQNDIVVPYLMEFGNEEQKKRWLPKCVSGEISWPSLMTEPDTGSDLAGIARPPSGRRSLCAERPEDVYHQRTLADLVSSWHGPIASRDTRD